MPSLQRYRYEDILADLNRVDCWLAQLGLAAKQDRIHFVIEVLRQVEAEYQRVQRGEPADEAADVRDRMFAICEALEFRDIYRAFRYEPPERIIRVLERALSGPHPLLTRINEMPMVAILVSNWLSVQIYDCAE